MFLKLSLFFLVSTSKVLKNKFNENFIGFLKVFKVKSLK